MPLVMWSGGHDSTLALFKTLKENADSHDGKPVETLVVRHDQLHDVKLKAEDSARKRIKDALGSRNMTFNEMFVNMTSKGNCGISAPHGVPQAALWVMTGGMYVGDGDKLVCGYIKGDDALRADTAVRKLFDALMVTLGKKAELVFPLEDMDKPQVLNDLERAGLVEYCWTCETPNAAGEPCGTCLPCAHLDAAWYTLRKARKWNTERLTKRAFDRPVEVKESEPLKELSDEGEPAKALAEGGEHETSG
jgi:7-cyano-7-deazaguanine synthase in queuosine biosynthesis